jgi:hypothetical protein
MNSGSTYCVSWAAAIIWHSSVLIFTYKWDCCVSFAVEHMFTAIGVAAGGTHRRQGQLFDQRYAYTHPPLYDTGQNIAGWSQECEYVRACGPCTPAGKIRVYSHKPKQYHPVECEFIYVPLMSMRCEKYVPDRKVRSTIRLLRCPCACCEKLIGRAMPRVCRVKQLTLTTHSYYTSRSWTHGVRSA